MSSVSSLSRLAVAIALGVSMQAAQAEEEAKELGTVTVVGDWLGEADQAVVQNHPGARSVVRRREMLRAVRRTSATCCARCPACKCRTTTVPAAATSP